MIFEFSLEVLATQHLERSSSPDRENYSVLVN